MIETLIIVLIFIVALGRGSVFAFKFLRAMYEISQEKKRNDQK
jgi:hypothetical protein